MVEDDGALCVLMERLLRRRGMSAEVMGRGDLALEAIETGDFDAIILDLMLPGMSGFEILDRLETTRPELLSRIVVLTAVSSATLQDFRFESRIWRLMRKPFDIDQFVDTVLGCTLFHAQWRQPRDEFARWFARRSAAVGAQAGVVALSDGRALHLRAAFGFQPGFAEAIFPLPMDGHYPICDAIRSRQPVMFASLMRARAEYPILLPIWTAKDAHSIAALPLAHDSTIVGGIGWNFGRSRAFEEPWRDEFLDVAAECGAMLSAAPSDRGTSATLR